MARGIRFRVFFGSDAAKRGLFPDRFYADMIAGNNEIVWQSEGYEEKASAQHVCQLTWDAMAKSFGGSTAQFPVPMTEDSLS